MPTETAETLKLSKSKKKPRLAPSFQPLKSPMVFLWLEIVLYDLGNEYCNEGLGLVLSSAGMLGCFRFLVMMSLML